MIFLFWNKVFFTFTTFCIYNNSSIHICHALTHISLYNCNTTSEYRITTLPSFAVIMMITT